MPCFVTLIFIDLLLRVNSQSVICNYDEDHYNALKVRQNKLTKDNYTLKEPILLTAKYTIAVQRENGWMDVHCYLTLLYYML